eukprot:s2591_g13.t1
MARWFVKPGQEKPAALEQAEEESWTPQDGQEQDEAEDSDAKANRRRKQARRKVKAWLCNGTLPDDTSEKAKQKAEEALQRQKADELERTRLQMMEEARQIEKAKAEEKRRKQEEASQGAKAEEEERQKRQLEEVRRIQEAAQMPQMFQVPVQTKPPTAGPKKGYSSGIRLRVFLEAGARRIVKQALTFGTDGSCDVVLPPGSGVQGEHLKLGYHEVKGWSLQPISGESVLSAVARYPALLEKLQLQCQGLPKGKRKNEVIDLLSENLCVFTLGNAKAPEAWCEDGYDARKPLGLQIAKRQQDPLMDLTEVAPEVPAVPIQEVPQMAEEQIHVQLPKPMEAPRDAPPQDMEVSEQTVEQTVEQSAPPTVQEEVALEPDAAHAAFAPDTVDTVDAMQSVTAPDETPSEAKSRADPVEEKPKADFRWL